MTDQDKLLQEGIRLWGDWFYDHDGEVESFAEMMGGNWVWERYGQGSWTLSQECGEVEIAIAEMSDAGIAHLIRGWAHDELVRRGYCIKVTDCSAGGDHGQPCKVYLLGDDILEYFGPTLPHAYLLAIKATETKP